MSKPYVVCNHRANADENGFVLVGSLLILMILVLIGIAATTSTILELQMAGADRTHRETFYKADGGAELGIELTFDNAVCEVTQNGFSKNAYGTDRVRIGRNIVVDDDRFAITLPPPPSISNANRHIVYYTEPGVDLTAEAVADYDNELNDYNQMAHTNILVYGETKVAPGSGLQMVAGYEGLGASAAGGGTYKLYTINSQHMGASNSESIIEVKWRLSTHILNSASSADCIY